MAVGPSQTQQRNTTSNKARHLIFFEGSELCYNYKTQQWTRIPAYDGIGFYSVNSKITSIGLVRFSSGSVDLQDQLTSFVAQAAVLTTGAPNINAGGRTVVSGIRPIVNGGTYSIRVGVQDVPSDAISYSSATVINSRSGMANFNAEGRYHRTELTISGGFTTANGVDVEFSTAGRV